MKLQFVFTCLFFILQVREKTPHSTPWRQNMARYGPDGEVSNIMSGNTPRSRMTRETLFSPRHLQSPGNLILLN